MGLRENRPNPDALLRRVERESDDSRGKLKIFFGSSPGVGKTFAMLEAAHTKKAAGVDVVVGVVETHGRSETASLVEGLEVLPRGVEFDLDAALLRKPELILIDELAHTNAKTSRHLKRWQDVEELLGAGIDVYSTLNVQHIESLNDVVAQITGVIVRETVPDAVIDSANEITLIDLPVDELIDRMKAGKVYVSDQAARALEHFFKPGNLNALREMALRRTADRVDSQMTALRGGQVDAKTWPVSERLLLAIGPTPYAANLVRATRRLATQWNAEWIVAYVQTSQHETLKTASRESVNGTLKLAESLGAETLTLAGESVAQAVLEYARSQNVTRIVVGKAPGSKLVGALMEGSGEISVVAIDGGARAVTNTVGRVKIPPLRELLLALGWIGGATAVALALREQIAVTNVVMVYLLAVVAVAARYQRTTAIFASVLSVASFDFFCVPPYYTFAISDAEYVLTFGVMLAVSLVISTLTVRLRQQATMAIGRENRTQSLFRLSKGLASSQRLFDAGEAMLGIAGQLFQAKVNLFLPDEENKISFRRRVSQAYQPPSQEEGIAQWAYDHGKLAGKGADTLPGATALYQALGVRGKNYGVFAIEDPPNDPEEIALLQAMLSLTAQAVDRLAVLDEARHSAVLAEGERLRSSLLSAVSHDLRTPLTSIAGAASTLRTQEHQLSPEKRAELLNAIEEESGRLSKLVTNLLEMTRLEDGRVRISEEMCSLEEIIGSALDGLDSQLGARPVKVSVAPDLPLIPGEAQLLEQALRNLIENAVKHTPAGSAIEIRAEREGERAKLQVLDEGGGFADGEERKLFEKFYRGKDAPVNRGVGLGLAIVQAIADAHGGTVRAANRLGKGALFELLLPLGRK